MTITASRLGSAPITLDWSNFVRPTTGPSAAQWSEEVGAAWSKLRGRFSCGEIGFYDTVINEDLSHLQETIALADRVLGSGQFTDALFLGIGGSALGPISLISATQELRKNRLRCHFVENPDPYEWKSTIAQLNPQTTLVVPITKSGTTFETMAQLLLCCEWLGKSRWKTHIIAVTDPAKGDLRTFVNAEGIPSLPVHSSIGGRFSIFCPVGLLPAALAGLDAAAFIQGAKQVRDFCEKAPLEKNPLFILGYEFLRQISKRPIHVCMPYSTRLRLIGDWFVQLWGESLGKEGKGFTPVAAVGATDQHSILQLLREGPDDKITMFVTVDQVPDEVKIPKLNSLPGQGSTNLPAFKILEGHTLQELLTIEYRATSMGLTKLNRPNLTIQLDRIDERSLGALYFMFSVLTGFTGSLMGVNPFDQPGVEDGKIYIREALSHTEPAPEDDDNSPVARLRRGRE